MVTVKRLTIIGTSVALRVRPPADNDNFNYGQRLEKQLNNSFEEQQWIVSNLGFSRAVIRDVLRNKNLFAQKGGDYIVLNIGAVDAPSRDVPLWLSDLLAEHNKGKLSYYLSNALNARIIKKIRPFLVKLRMKRSWTSMKRFENGMRELLLFLRKDTPGRIIVLGINSGNDRVEKALPGTNRKYKSYNEKLEAICNEMNTDFVSVEDLNSAAHYPDGVHYNSAGHKEIAERIKQVIINLEEK